MKFKENDIVICKRETTGLLTGGRYIVEKVDEYRECKATRNGRIL